jgi:RecA-family ATPase
MADALSSGVKWWNTFEVKEKANVLYVENEIGEYELQRRIKMRYDKIGC